MIFKLNKFFATIAFLSIATFFTSTLIVELFYNHETIALVKSLIVCPGLFILVPSIAITAISGNKIAKINPISKVVKAQKRRMPIIALNGTLILLPAAIYLNILASNGEFDTKFYIIQAFELFAGATNLTLMFLNIRDSIRG